MRSSTRRALPYLMAAVVATALSSGGCGSSAEPAVDDPEFESDWTEDFENDTEEDLAEQEEQDKLDQLDDLDDVEALDGEGESEDPSYENAPFDQTTFATEGGGMGDEGQAPGAIDPSREDHPRLGEPGVDDDGNELPADPDAPPAPMPLHIKGTTTHDKHGPISIIEDDPWFSGQQWMPGGTYNYDVDLATTRMAEAKALGAKVVRIMLWWSSVAPNPKSLTKPAGFVASQPGGYDWRGLDAQIIAARRNNLKVLITATAGNMPYWASEEPSVCASRISSGHTWSCSWRPDPKEYAKFVTAVGRHVKQRHFRIWAWTLVNEPNIGGFLSDRDSKNDGDKNSQMEVAFRYRRLWFGARKALRKTAHVTARVFFSDQANNQKTKGEHLTPASARWNLFDWSLCLDTEWNPDLVSGKYKCPIKPRKAICQGIAFHPYATTAGQANYSEKFLERLVDDAAEAGRISKGRGLYMTEGGFLTAKSSGGNALGASSVVTPKAQGIAINELDRMQWHNPRIKSTAQYEMIDEGRGSWDCGLRYAWGDVHIADAVGTVVSGDMLQIKTGTRVVIRDAAGALHKIAWAQIAAAPWDANTKWFQRTGAGAMKPAYIAYRMGISVVRSGDEARIFGHARFDTGLGFSIDGLYDDGWHEITTVKTDELGYGEKTIKIGKAKAFRTLFGGDYSRTAH
jgi:hypothetical protein